MHRKQRNISRWAALGLSVLAVMAFLILATGSAWARYRSEIDMFLKFKVRTPSAVYVGVIDSNSKIFTIPDTFAWTLADGKQQLDFAVANGRKKDSFDKRDQKFQVRLICSLGIWTGEEPAVIQLKQTGANEKDEKIYLAEVVPIAQDSVLHHTFGDGWVCRFLDEQGEELYWSLEGGVFDYKTLNLSIVLEDGQTITPTLVQLQVISEVEE